MIRKVTLTLLLACLCVALAAAAEEKGARQSQIADWLQWAGPDSNGTSPEKGLLREWPEGGPKVLWRAKISQGWGCASVAGADVVCAGTIRSTGGWEKSDLENVICLDAQTGKERWTHTYEIGGHYQQKDVGWDWGGVRATPTITEKFVYSLGVLGELDCLDRKTGAVVWQRNLLKDFWPSPHREWKGFCFSPVVKNDTLIFPFCCNESPAGKDARWAIAACIGINALTGKNAWNFESKPVEKKDELAQAQVFQTPAFATFGKDNCAIYNIGDCLTAYRLSDGKEVLNFRMPAGNSGNLASPIVTERGIVIRSGPAVVEINRESPPFTAKMSWSHGTAEAVAYGNYLPVGDYLYGFRGGANPNDIPKSVQNMVCIEMATGKLVWEQKGFPACCSIIAADGLLFARSFQSLYLVEASPKGYVQKGKIEKLHDVSNIRGADGGWAMPALAGGKLYVRTPSELICYKISKEE
jgi:outer membrane protein assembly factor BamB